MFERFTKDARTVVKDAEAEAHSLGSPAIEAEHLLLAIARHPDKPAGRALAEVGLDHHGVHHALEAETDRSLLAVGITPAELEPPGGPVATTGRIRVAASARLALERALRAALDRDSRRIEPAHILLGILRAEAGTVPRALAIAEVDRNELSDRVAAAIGQG
jgi:ATP-dependent Clp protease ATP-binding subunit ClpA